jgi:hypothetical protein
MSDEPSTFRPPYMSFQTFWKYIEELASKPLPPRIDRSMMRTKSGTDQANLTMALTSFGLTDGEGTVLPALTQLTSTPTDDRPAVLADLVRRYYAGPMRVSEENGTQAALNSVFSEDYPSIASADTRRKAITFFLHAATTANLSVSPHFPSSRPGSGSPGAPKPKRQGTRRKAAAAADDAGSQEHGGTEEHEEREESRRGPGTRGTSQTVELESGGTLTLTYDLSLFELDEDDEEFVLGLIRQLRNYAKRHDESVEVGS